MIATPQHDSFVARALDEALETVTTPPVRDSVIARALRESGLSSVPERGPEVIEFAEGALMRALARRLGDEVAAEVLDQMRPVLLRASARPSFRPSTPRNGTARPVRASASPALVQPQRVEVRTRPAPEPKPEHDGGGDLDGGDGAIDEEASGVFVAMRRVATSAPARTEPAPTSALPTVLFVSRDGDAAIALAIALGGHGTVRVIEGLLDLMDALEEDEDGARIVVIDGLRGAVQIPSLITIAPDLAGRATMILWRATAEDQVSLDGARQLTSAWRSCGERGSDLAAACMLEIGILEIDRLA